MTNPKDPTKPKQPSWFELGFKLFLEGWTFEKIGKHSQVNRTAAAVSTYAKKNNWKIKRDELQGKSVRSIDVDLNAFWRLKCPELQEQVYLLIRQGINIQTIAELFGFSKGEFDQWADEDINFKRKILQAIRQFEVETLKKIENYGGRDWKSKSWQLEQHATLREQYKPKEDKNEGVRILIDFRRNPISEIDDQTTLTLLGTNEKETELVSFTPNPNLANAEHEVEALKTKLVTTAEDEPPIETIVERQKRHLEAVRKAQAARKQNNKVS